MSTSPSYATSPGAVLTTTWAVCAQKSRSTSTFRCCRPRSVNLVAHEAYPGHHTERVRKEVGLLRRHQCWEESIVLIGTPENLVAEGLADLGLEIVMAPRPDVVVAEHLRPLGISYDPDVVAVVQPGGRSPGRCAANAAFRLWEDKADSDTVIDEVAHWGLTTRAPSRKAGRVLVAPDLAGLHLVLRRGAAALSGRFVGGDPIRFAPPYHRAAHPEGPLGANAETRAIRRARPTGPLRGRRVGS